MGWADDLLIAVQDMREEGRSGLAVTLVGRRYAVIDIDRIEIVTTHETESEALREMDRRQKHDEGDET